MVGILRGWGARFGMPRDYQRARPQAPARVAADSVLRGVVCVHDPTAAARDNARKIEVLAKIRGGDAAGRDEANIAVRCRDRAQEAGAAER
jgi:hypothetical protein